VLFATTATNLGNGDTDTVQDVHVRDLDTDRTILVSRASGAAGAKGTGVSSPFGISADGRRVLIGSASPNLAPGDTDMGRDAFIRDLDADTTELVSVGPDGTKANKPIGLASLDASGRRLAFDSAATNLAGAATPHLKVFVRDLDADTLVVASRADGAEGGLPEGAAHAAMISPDGGYVAFLSSAPGLAADAPAGVTQAYLRDVANGGTQLVSRRSGAGAPSARPIGSVSISDGGGCVGFASPDGLVGPAGDLSQAYLRAVRADCSHGRPDPDGPGGPGTPGGPGGPGGGPSTPSGGPDPSGPGADRLAPRLSSAKLSRRRIRVGQKSVLSFRASEKGSLEVTYDRVRGKRVKRAAAATHRIRAGSGRIGVTWRVGKKKLAPGTYRMTLVARDAAGNRSKPVRLKLTILRKG
jgi:hypothetical protein